MMRFATMLGGAIAMTSTITPTDAMSTFRWKNRLVVVIAEPGEVARLAERDIVVVWVAGNSVRAEPGPGPA